MVQCNDRLRHCWKTVVVMVYVPSQLYLYLILEHFTTAIDMKKNLTQFIVKDMVDHNISVWYSTEY